VRIPAFCEGIQEEEEEEKGKKEEKKTKNKKRSSSRQISVIHFFKSLTGSGVSLPVLLDVGDDIK
jgi:hypothetical protein